MMLIFITAHYPIKTKRRASPLREVGAKMPPITDNGNLKTVVNDYVTKNKVMVFSKTTCPFCTKVSLYVYAFYPKFQCFIE